MEREFCSVLLKRLGLSFERNLDQYQKSDGRDLKPKEGKVPLCIQVKGGKSPPLFRAAEEAAMSALPGEIPFAAVRKDRGEWHVILKWKDFARVLSTWLWCKCSEKEASEEAEESRQRTDTPG